MKLNDKLALVVLAAAAIGLAGSTVIRAQQVKAPPAYIIVELEVTDPATFQKYAQGINATLESFNGRYVVRAGKTQVLEGEAPKRIVVLAFDSAEKAQAWVTSPAYEAIKPIRHSSAKTRSFIVEGIAPQ
jgi:uncharacterized protein (DUF1330 family)